VWRIIKMVKYSDIVIFESLYRDKLIDDVNKHLDGCDNNMDIKYKPLVFVDEEGLDCILYTVIIKHIKKVE